MSVSRWPLVVDALIDTLAAVPNLAGKVYDGIPVTAEHIPDGVFIGVVLDEDASDAGKWDQRWHEMGGLAPRDESGSIQCSVLSQSGDGDIAAVRTSAFTHLGYVEAACRGDYDLDVPDVQWLHLTGAKVRQGLTPRGAYCEVVFTITYQALI